MKFDNLRLANLITWYGKVDCSVNISIPFYNLNKKSVDSQANAEKMMMTQMNDYLREYEKTENIVFDKRNIMRNPDLPNLCLNSFWGKFGQFTEYWNRENASAFRYIINERRIWGYRYVNHEWWDTCFVATATVVVRSLIINIVIAYTTT